MSGPLDVSARMLLDAQDALLRRNAVAPIPQKPLDELVPSLVEAAKQSRLSVIVGAGLSYDCGLPTWRQLILRLANALVRPEDRRAFDLLTSQASAVASARLLKEFLGIPALFPNEVHRALYSEPYDFARPNPSLDLVRALAGLAAQTNARFDVITYNFDNLLEYAFDHASEPIPYDVVASAEAHAKAFKAIKIYHVHGYDLLNRLTYADYNSAAGSGVSYAYDALSRRTKETTATGALTYQFDLAGDLTQITWPDSFYAGYAFDTVGRVTSINANGSSSKLATYSYDNWGHRTEITFGNGASTSYGYDTFGRLLSLGQVFTRSTGNVTFGYSYDAANEITDRTVSKSSYVGHPSAASKIYVSTGVNSYSSVSATNYTYDARQNLKSDGTRTFTYDSENHLLTGSAPTAVTLTYDPIGRLQTSTASSTTTTFLYNGAFLAAEYNGSTVARRYVPGPGVDEPLIWYQGSGTTTPQWLHTDDTGSVIAYSNSSGQEQAIYTYGASGEPGAWSGSRYSYTGQIMIPEAQLYYYKARVYDPVMGRFLQTDPIGYASDMNLYSYAANDPVNLSDPMGTADAPCNPGNNCVVVTGSEGGGGADFGGGLNGISGISIGGGLDGETHEVTGANENSASVTVTAARRTLMQMPLSAQPLTQLSPSLFELNPYDGSGETPSSGGCPPAKNGLDAIGQTMSRSGRSFMGAGAAFIIVGGAQVGTALGPEDPLATPGDVAVALGVVSVEQGAAASFTGGVISAVATGDARKVLQGFAFDRLAGALKVHAVTADLIQGIFDPC